MSASLGETTEILEQIETPDYASIRDSFCEELKLASQGQPTSLPFIHNIVPTFALVKPGEIFQIFVIGGTNGETATVRYNADDTVSIIDYHAHPELVKFKTHEDLLQFIDRHVDDMTNIISINFAFALEPKQGEYGQLDGIMLGGDNKGHAFEGLANVTLGKMVADYFQQVHKRKVTVSVANDVACLIAAIGSKDIDYNTLVAGIIGTGYNMSFFLDEHTIINIQAADFKGFKPTKTGRTIDHDSDTVGHQLYAKEVAGGDLFKHYNLLIEQLKLKSDHIHSSKELAGLAIVNQDKEGFIARALLKRSASLVAAHFAGFYNFKGRPAKLTAVMQGSLFWEGPNYKETIVEELVNLGVPAEAIVFEMLERSGIIGAAKLVTGSL